MRSTRWLTHCLHALVGACAFWASSAAEAQYFRDDFEDGSIADGVPATWKRYAPPFDQGEIEVLDGSLVLTPLTSGTPSVPDVGLYWETDVYLADYLYHDVNVKTQFRALGSGTTVAGVTVLDTEATEGPSGVFVGGHVYEEGATRWMRINYSGVRGSGPLATKTLPFSHLTDEVSLRMVVTGLNVTLTAWPADQPEPAPQLVTRLPADFSGKMGHIAAFAGNRTTSVPIAFRYIEVSAVPEPTTSILLGVACAALAARRRRGTPWRGGSARFAALAAAMLAVGNAGQAATIFYDDFEDGSATDGSPVTWMPEVPPWPVGQQRVEAGSLILTPAREAFPSPNWYETDWEVQQDMPTDIVVRTSVRALLGIGDAYHSVYARDTTSVDARQGVYTSLVLGTNGYMQLLMGKNLVTPATILVDGTFPELQSRRHDVHLEFRLSGRDVQVFAWPEGTSRPANPRLQALSPLENVAIGRVGIAFAHRANSPSLSGAFRFVEVAQIPEPSTLGLLGLAAAGGMRRSSRRRLPSVR